MTLGRAQACAPGNVANSYHVGHYCIARARKPSSLLHVLFVANVVGIGPRAGGVGGRLLPGAAPGSWLGQDSGQLPHLYSGHYRWPLSRAHAHAGRPAAPPPSPTWGSPGLSRSHAPGDGPRRVPPRRAPPLEGLPDVPGSRTRDPEPDPEPGAARTVPRRRAAPRAAPHRRGGAPPVNRVGLRTVSLGRRLTPPEDAAQGEVCCPSPVRGRCSPPCSASVLADRARTRRERPTRTTTPRRLSELRIASTGPGTISGTEP